MRHLDLFSGIGGFALACSWVWEDEYQNVGHSDIEPYACKVYHKHFPGSLCLGDITKIEWKEGQVDLITAGFPCQPFSSASRGRITAVDLSGEVGRCAEAVRPNWIVCENVQRKAFDEIDSILSRIGYVTAIKRIGAHEVGADHQRNRWWLIAHANDKGEFRRTFNAEAPLVQEIRGGVWNAENFARAIRVPYGLSNRVDRLAGLGNSIVPQVAYEILKPLREFI